MKLDGNTVISINLSVDMTNVILGALSTQPYERVVGIINTIQQQAATQLVPQEPVQEAAAAPESQE
jgi:hypothetical protein